MSRSVHRGSLASSLRFSASLAGARPEAKEAAVALVGADRASGAKGVLEPAAGALVGIVASLDKGIALISDTAEAAHKVPLMDGLADKLAGAASEMSESTALLRQLSDSMDGIADVLAKVGAALDRVGDHLTDTSAQAQGFMSRG